METDSVEEEELNNAGIETTTTAVPAAVPAAAVEARGRGRRLRLDGLVHHREDS